MDLHQEFQSSRFFHQARIDQRTAESLIGISAGLIADGTINQKEAEFLKRWIETNMTHLEDPVINVLYRRLASMLQDGILQDEEAAELLDLLHRFSPNATSDERPFKTPTTLPLDDPQPELVWQDRTFVFTGTMAYGPRRACEELVENRGGRAGKTVCSYVNYLVVGSIGNEQWLNSSYGTKIMRAVELREHGVPIAIVSEHHWQKAMFW